MSRILFLVSSARTIRLTTGHDHETGYWAEEVLKPYRRFIEAGVDVVIATPDGKTPHPDSYGLQHIFHYPDEDEDFLFGVMRSFMSDLDDIRVTLQHLTTLDLIAARRVFQALQAAGASEARGAIELNARKAWAENLNFIDLLSCDPQVTRHVGAPELRKLSDVVQQEGRDASAQMCCDLEAIPGMRQPKSLMENGTYFGVLAEGHTRK